MDEFVVALSIAAFLVSALALFLVLMSIRARGARQLLLTIGPFVAHLDNVIARFAETQSSSSAIAGSQDEVKRDLDALRVIVLDRELHRRVVELRTEIPTYDEGLAMISDGPRMNARNLRLRDAGARVTDRARTLDRFAP